MKLCWQKEKPKEDQRRITVNDSTFNKSFGYASNYISTSKYNVVSFFPKNLFEQFQRIANTYFLVLLILQLIPEISSLTPLTTVIPLVAVLAISAIKDAVDDIQRHRSDSQVNNRLSWVLRGGQLVEERWHNVDVGDIIKMENDQFVAADLFLLSTSEPNSLCYIETAELDGETNLKVRQALTETAEMEDNIEQLSKFDGEILCEPPNNQLNKFDGVLKWKGVSHAVNNDKILLRGCVLRNTKWCYGLVIFAGKDTKLMMNSGKTKFKRTHIDKLMNLLIVGIFIFLLITCSICTICCGIWESLVGYRFQVFLPWERFVPGSSLQGNPGANVTVGSAVTSFLVFLSYFIVLNTVVPISLYVSVEMIRFGHSWWINWDDRMYYTKTDTPAKSRTTTLNEELGQIDYIFSDKTGTLTKNVMTFDRCTINGKVYGDVLDESGNVMDVTANTPKVDFSDNPMYEPNFCFYDERLWDAVKTGDPHVHMFFRLIALCHTVMPEDKDGLLEYQAQSPDEGALVSAARNFGFVFKARTPNSITIEVMGRTEEHELLCILDFNNERKRMSVILKKDGRITLYCKGADSTIYHRLDPVSSKLQEITTSQLSVFAQSGLRTLCCAVKDIDLATFAEWNKRHHVASVALDGREEQLSAVYEEIEQNMILIGATAIEDKLQDGVPEAIANLALAGMKIWVLTGDKQETAVNIAYSCKLLTDEMEEIYTIDGETYERVEEELQRARDDIDIIVKRNFCRADGQMEVISYSNGSISMQPSPLLRHCFQSEDFGGFALIINGHSLVHALDKKMEMLLLDVSCMCKAVICCRVTPLQKALVVDLIKRHKKSLTLAIGDGANDVSMIKMAHIGVGISGQEGMQAVLASDFALAQFRYLERLLLVHGRWSYLRMCKFLKYFFYKNFAFTLCHLWYAVFCGFSAQTLYDEAFISLYNVCYTSLPILALGIFDQDVSDAYSLRYPKLYTPGRRDMLFNKKIFAQSVVEGILTSLVLFFVPYFAFYNAIKTNGQDVAGHRAFGTIVSSSLIVTVTLRCALDTSYWTGFNHFVIWGSILFYFGFTFVFYSELFDYTYLGTAVNVMGTANFWFTLVLTVTTLLLPVVAARFYHVDTCPTLTEKVRMKQRISKSKSKSGDLVLRRTSTTRRSQRSLRSGYAFAHQEGFGELITTGSMMQMKRRRISTASSFKSCLPIARSKQSGAKDRDKEKEKEKDVAAAAVAPGSQPSGKSILASPAGASPGDGVSSSSHSGVEKKSSPRFRQP